MKGKEEGIRNKIKKTDVPCPPSTPFPFPFPRPPLSPPAPRPPTCSAAHTRVSSLQGVPITETAIGTIIEALEANFPEAGIRLDSAAVPNPFFGVSSATFYAWKAKFGGMEVSDAKRLRALEDENGKLKRLLADAMLDNAGLKDLLAKKW